MRTIFVILSIVSILIYSCKKTTVIIVPEACLKVNKTIASKGDTIEFTDCSEGATTTMLYFLRDNSNPAFPYPAYSFDSNRKVFISLTDTGMHTAILQASRNESGSPIKTMEVKVNVIP